MYRKPAKTDMPTAIGAALLSFSLIVCGTLASSRANDKYPGRIFEHAELERSQTGAEFTPAGSQDSPAQHAEDASDTYQKN